MTLYLLAALGYVLLGCSLMYGLVRLPRWRRVDLRGTGEWDVFLVGLGALLWPLTFAAFVVAMLGAVVIELGELE